MLKCNIKIVALLIMVIVSAQVFLMYPVQALKNPCTTYDSINNTLTVKCSMNIVQIAADVNDSSKIAYLGKGEWLLNTTILTASYTTLSINSSTDNISWLKITGENGLIIGGKSNIDGIKITSWDQAANTTIDQFTNGSVHRGYIYFKASKGGWIKNSDIGYLGYDRLYRPGIAIMQNSHDLLFYNNKIHDSYYATYSSGAYNVTIDGNEYYGNLLYAIDPHTDSYNFKITNNHVHHNYKFGIIFSLRCVNFLVENNIVHDNGGGKTGYGYGIMFSRMSDNSTVRRNVVYNEYISIDISQSSNGEVYDNKISDSKIGILILSGIEGSSKNNSIRDNEIKNSEYGIYSNNATGNKIINTTFAGMINVSHYVLGNNSKYQIENQKFIDTKVSGLTGNNTLTIVNSGDIRASGISMQDTTASFGMSTYSKRPIHAEYVNGSSTLIGKKINSILVQMRKVGAPTGDVQIGIFNDNLSVKKLFGTMNASNLSTSYLNYVFPLSSLDSYQIQMRDRIGIKFNGGNSTNYVSIMTDQNIMDPFDGVKSFYTYYTTAWNSYPTKDLYMTLELNSTTYNTDVMPATFYLTSDSLKINEMN